MPNPENPFDTTIWDPFTPEQAIEDPLHGPSAVEHLLNLPRVPLGDGRYYRPGGFYLFGTVYVDEADQPLYVIQATPRGPFALAQEQQAISQWLEAYANGTLPDGATAQDFMQPPTTSLPATQRIELDIATYGGGQEISQGNRSGDPIQKTRRFYEGLRDVSPDDEPPAGQDFRI